MTDVVALLGSAFSDLHPRLRFEFAPSADGRVNVSVTELDENGALAGRVDQSVDLARVATDRRVEAFVQGCATAARERAASPPRAGALLDWFTPSDVLPTLLLDASELETPAAYAAALLEPWGVLARLQTRELCRDLAEDLPEAMAVVRLDDDDDLQLVDALFALFSDRHGTRRTMELLRRAADMDRRHLAQLLVGFLDRTAVDADLRANAYLLDGKPIANPLGPDVAFRILVRWGVPLGDRPERWARAGAISPEVAAGR